MNKKQQLFKKYAEDLELIVKQGQRKMLAIDADSGKKYSLDRLCYVCPLCDRIFFEEDIDRLTLEHVPPGTLSGQKSLLVCKDCNNSQGSSLEKHLIDEIRSKARGTRNVNLQLTNGTQPSIKCKLRVNQNSNEIIFLVDRKNKAAPYHYFNQQKLQAQERDEQIGVSLQWKYPQRKIQLALLRIAYLKMFEVGGYNYYLSYSAQMIRSQLASLRDKELPVFYSAQPSDLPEGVYAESQYYSGFLVAITFKVEDYENRYLVLLPGPNQEHMELYKNLEKQPKANLTLTRLSEN